MKNVLTLIADPARSTLEGALIESLVLALGEQEANDISCRWLHEGHACDVFFSHLDLERARAIASERIGTAPIDLIALPAHGRRKALLVADMDSTMVEGETLDDLAAAAGAEVQALIAAITARAMNGEIDFKPALRERVSYLKNLPLSALDETFSTLRLMGGARLLVRTMKAHGAHTVLVSGGFKYFTQRVAALCGFDEDFSNHLEIADEVLTGRVIEPVLDRDAKLQTLLSVASDHGLSAEDALAVGDGANDLDMIRAAGLGVAFHAKPIVAAKASVQINHNDLTALLYAQGYSKDQFIED